MGRSNQLLGTAVVAVVAMLTLGTVAAGVPILAAPAVVDGPASAATLNGATPIESCTTITDPGEYVLTQDVAASSGAEPCLVFELDGDVVVDGQGYSVTGGVELETATEEGSLAFDLSDATVDRIRYPTRGQDPGATGRLSNVDVGTVELINARGLTIESSTVRNDLTMTFAGTVTVENSTVEGEIDVNENAANVRVVDSTFAGPVTFAEDLTNGYLARNSFASSLSFFNAGGPAENVTVENNTFTVDAAAVSGLEEGAIVFVEGFDSVVRDNTIVVEGSVETDFVGANGIYLVGENMVVSGNAISGADNGIILRSLNGRIVENDLSGNDVGIRIDSSTDRVARNAITDNRVGVLVTNEVSTAFERNVVAGNDEFGVLLDDSDPFGGTVGDDYVFDARNNYWGAADGPSSAPVNDADAPFTDPVTDAPAGGSGDAVSEGETAGVSDVRFDPFLTAPPGDDAEPERFYQVDFVADNDVGDDVIERFGPADSDNFYSAQGRLIGFLHGSTTAPVERTGTVRTLSEDVAACVQVESWRVEGDTATVRFTVAEDCRLDVALVSYEKPDAGWSRATASEQRLVDVDREILTSAGTFELRVSLPTDRSEETSSLARPALTVR